MGTRLGESTGLSGSPARIFALVLLVVFVVEGLIMLCLPSLPSEWRGSLLEGLLDASTLTAVAAPAIWLLAVRPLRRLFEMRGQLLQRLFETQEQERARIARDLHDGVGQHLTALLVGLRGLEGAGDQASVSARARDLREVAAIAHGEVRRLARGLRPVILEELGLVTAIERLCEDFELSRAIKTTSRCEGMTDERLAPALETALYRITQEALTNVGQHAGASQVEVRIARNDGAVTLSIRDDGRGFGIDETAARARGDGGFGLGSMRERASLLGGSFVVRTTVGVGTSVEVRMPTRE